MKLLGFGFIDCVWMFEYICFYLLEVIDVFGVDCCLFVSDFLIDGLFVSFDWYFDVYVMIVVDFIEVECCVLFGCNIDWIYWFGFDF